MTRGVLLGRLPAGFVPKTRNYLAMYKARGADAAPPHPGEILREDVLPCLDMGTLELARHLGIAEMELLALLNEERPVTPALASRLGIAFGQGARYWIALQALHDGWKAEEETPEGVRPLAWSKRVRERRKRPAPTIPRAA
mgnify:CR=1 FL=1